MTKERPHSQEKLQDNVAEHIGPGGGWPRISSAVVSSIDRSQLYPKKGHTRLPLKNDA